MVEKEGGVQIFWGVVSGRQVSFPPGGCSPVL